MARIKITNAAVEAKLTQWNNNVGREDVLIFFKDEINETALKQKAWDLAGMIVNFADDTGPIGTDGVVGFRKITFSEKL